MDHKIKTSKEHNETIYQECKNHFYAHAFNFNRWFPQYEIEELIAESWLRGVHAISNPKFVRNRIKYGMIDFIRADTKSRNKKRREKVYLFSDLDPSSDHFHTTCLGSRPDPGVLELESEDFLNWLINFSGLSEKEQMHFLETVDEMTPSEIAQKHDLTLNQANGYVHRARRKIQKTLEKMENNL